MKKPKTLRKLYKIVNPQDLCEVLEFSGINDKPNTDHWKIKREFSKKVFDSKGKFGWKTLGYCNVDLSDKHYDTILKCIQDFYRWSHQFNHSHAHIYQRVQNALDIPLSDISIIMDG